MRSKPVSRSEVRIKGEARWNRYIYTWPLSACRKRKVDLGGRDAEDGYEPVAELFEPLVAELRSEWEYWREWYSSNANRAWQRYWQRQSPPTLPPTLPTYDFPAEPITCKNCGSKFLAEATRFELRYRTYCSDRCIRQSPAGRKARARRVERLAKRRREARADLVCQYAPCGKPLEAQRAGKRYCCDAHKVAAWRARQKAEKQVLRNRSARRRR
jgi:hypothetical protein